MGDLSRSPSVGIELKALNLVWENRRPTKQVGATIPSGKHMAELENNEGEPLYCPACKAEVRDPLVCGDCGAVICRKCGTPLEKVDELGIG